MCSSYHHCLMEKGNRQQALKFQYHFACYCTACCKDYPTVQELHDSPDVRDVNSDGDIEKLTSLDIEFAKQNLKRYCQYLKDIDKRYPCRQISEAQENLKLCFHILVENYSLRAKIFK